MLRGSAAPGDGSRVARFPGPPGVQGPERASPGPWPRAEIPDPERQLSGFLLTLPMNCVAWKTAESVP